jgi:hypothetical protein
VPEQPAPPAAVPPIQLKDPLLAGFLGWLIPGLGHLYQRRFAKAGLFFVCILGTFLYGLYLGSNQEIGWGRVVYFSLRTGDTRLAYLCQVGAGLPALPALIQSLRVSEGKEPLLGRFMAPPRLELNESHQWTPRELYRYRPRLFELGTVYTMIAGLLNILAVYDACCGPVVMEPAKKDDEEKKDEAQESV